ncbi:dihydroxyacetone kinase subunit DhaL [Vallitalea okinawensis]|uniref:dihydroxyacetone kinase subunit DhaL n=1 Tax=Vallitalea okinawensis TaxID=2078660 RepID=UPI000CFB1D35|nr:dihydroxyacetone kinase subunit DhaL [Vallitalea okinawensis]
MLTGIDVHNMLLVIATTFIEKEDELSMYDAVIGDGDHGVTMARGAKAAIEKLKKMEEGSCRDYFKVYGRTLVSTLGGAMGPLFGCIFLELSKACKGKKTVGLMEIAVGFRNAEIKVMDLGGAKVGDKTMIDAIHPTVEAFQEALDNKLSLERAFDNAVLAADAGVQSTIPMKAKRGRSKFLQDKSIGHQDAGATSFYYLIKTMNDYIHGLKSR